MHENHHFDLPWSVDNLIAMIWCQDPWKGLVIIGQLSRKRTNYFGYIKMNSIHLQMFSNSVIFFPKLGLLIFSCYLLDIRLILFDTWFFLTYHKKQSE